MKAASSQQGPDTWLLRAYSRPHPNTCVSLLFPVYPLLQLLPVGAHDLRLLPIPELVHGPWVAHACLLRYLDSDYVCHKNASGSWQIYWGNCISSYACRSLPGDKLWELCALKKKNRRFGKLILMGDWVIKWLQLLSFLLNLFLLCVIPLMEGLRQSAGRAVIVFFLKAVTALKNKWSECLLSPRAPSSSPLTQSLFIIIIIFTQSLNPSVWLLTTQQIAPFLMFLSVGGTSLLPVTFKITRCSWGIQAGYHVT